MNTDVGEPYDIASINKALDDLGKYPVIFLLVLWVDFRHLKLPVSFLYWSGNLNSFNFENRKLKYESTAYWFWFLGKPHTLHYSNQGFTC